MVIFFSCSTKDILKYKKYYLEIRKSILSLNHTINRDWLPYSIGVAEKQSPDVSPTSIYHDVMSAILTADYCIFDVTTRSMSVGHQLTFALQKRKPVLVLQKDVPEREKNDLFISEVKSPFMVIKNYSSLDEIKPIIKSFVHKYEARSKTRFNLVLNNTQDSYVEWASYYYKMSKTELIQKAIEERMGSDKNYEKYIDL